MKRVLLLIICIVFGTYLIKSCQKDFPKDEHSFKSDASNYISYSADEICLGDAVTVTFDNGYNNNCGNMQIQMSSDGGETWVQVAMGTPIGGILEYSFTPADEGYYLFRGKWNATGQGCSSTGTNISFAQSLTLFPLSVVSDCCELGFEGVAVSCDDTREVIYTFTADEDMSFIKIQGGLTNFTGGDAVVEVSGGNLTIDQWTPGGSSNRIIRLQGSVTACETVTIRILWNFSNSGNVITGSWSVKDSEGLELAPVINGLTCE